MPQIKYGLSNRAIKALMLIIATLLIVWPLPGTVALRYALAGMLSVTLIGLSFKARMAKPIFQTSGPVVYQSIKALNGRSRFSCLPSLLSLPRKC